MEDLAGAAPPKGRAKACTACRQVKLKCDAREVYPNPCSRCKAHELDCRMDPSFKRVPARRQLEEVSERLINLQRSLGLDEDSTLPPVASNVPIPPRFDRLTSATNQDRVQEESTDQHKTKAAEILEPGIRFLDLQEEPQHGQWTIGDVTVSYRDTLILFKHFDAVLSRHVPFLEPCHSLYSMHKTNHLLFWTIVLISCRLYNHYDELYQRLLPHHRVLISTRVFGARPTLDVIHALLLICTWPYPVNTQHDDNTWLFCGVSITLAMSMGLHKPDHGHEYTRNETDRLDGSPSCRKMTWLACFQTSTR